MEQDAQLLANRIALLKVRSFVRSFAGCVGLGWVDRHSLISISGVGTWFSDNTWLRIVVRMHNNESGVDWKRIASRLISLVGRQSSTG